MPLDIIEALEQEPLAEALVQRLRDEAPQRGVLEPACVLVQNAGLGRWLQLWHARHCGISAGLAMPFARSFIAKTLEETGLYDRQHSIDEDRMQWLIFAALVSRQFESWGESGQPLRAYLNPDQPNLERRCWQLAGMVAELFDQYAIYRPQWLRSWVRDPADAAPMEHWGWQARLFGVLMEEMGWTSETVSQGILGLALHDFYEGETLVTGAAPVHVFGVSSFSPAFLKFFSRLSQTTPVTVYHLVCSEAFLGDLPANYRQSLLNAGDTTGETVEMPETVDNPCLVANGQATARFQSLLLALEYSIGGHPLDSEFDGTSDLRALKHSLRQNEGTTTFAADGSVSFHSCHSRMREVQVLQQQLLALFAGDPALRPEDILVLMPEISEYVDAIETVFGQGAKLEGREHPVTVSYCIADRRNSEDENCWRFFEAFLDFLKGRQAFSEVAGLLDFDPVCERLQISRDEMQELLSTLQVVGVRWGIDGSTRAMQAQPDFEAYSWDYGLQRLYDGLLLPADGQTACAPYAVSSRMAEIVGNLTQLLRCAFELVRRRDEKRSFRGWSGLLVPVLRGFIGEESDGGAWAGILFPAFGKAKEAASDVAIGFDTFCEILGGWKQEVSGPSGLLRRGVTFCRLQPARHIPAKVICILGMNEGAYPRRERRAEFDLIDLQRRSANKLKGTPFALNELNFLGDHRVRDEDRQLFLDCILNAKERLYISYIGQSDKSNEAIPPSLLVSELQQFLARAPESAAIGGVIVRHPLQEWSRTNFIHPQFGPDEPPAPIHFETSLATLRDEPDAVSPFLDASAEEIPEDGEDETAAEVDAKELVRFLKDPARYYLRQRLLVDLNQLDWEDVYEDRETLEMDGLHVWHFRERLVEECLASIKDRENKDFSPGALKRKLQLELALPPGLAGEQIWADVAEPVLDGIARHLEGERLDKERTEQRFETVKFSSESWTLSDGRRLILLNGDLKPKYLLEAYILNLGAPMGSLLLCLSDQSAFDVPRAQAETAREEEAWLADLLRLWAEGRRRPLPFSLEIAAEYVKDMINDPSADRENLLDRAYRRAWHSAYNACDDSPAQRLCFDEDSPAAPGSPFREAFAATAEIILTPVLMWAKNVTEGKRT
ncbi:MAG: exodeoxyribonuclease V subunit gamma [Opitutales bacterium]